jgi:endonuclease YncB( thermonuclease family)
MRFFRVWKIKAAQMPQQLTHHHGRNDIEMKLAHAGLFIAANALALTLYENEIGAAARYLPSPGGPPDTVRVTQKANRLPQTFAHRSPSIVLEGPAEVLDGNTLLIENQRVGLLTSSTCESGQAGTVDSRALSCGSWAKEGLEKIVGGWVIRCTGHLFDADRLVLANCARVDGTDVGMAMIRNGYGKPGAMAKDTAEMAEAVAEAKAAKAGIWSLAAVRRP